MPRQTFIRTVAIDRSRCPTPFPTLSGSLTLWGPRDSTATNPLCSARKTHYLSESEAATVAGGDTITADLASPEGEGKSGAAPFHWSWVTPSSDPL